RPLAAIHDLVRFRMVVVGLVRFSKDADADLDESAAGFGLIPSEGLAVRLILFTRTGHRGKRRGDDIITVIAEIVNIGIFLEPGAVIVVPFVFEARDTPGPIEPRRAVEALFRVWEIELRTDLIVVDFRGRKFGRDGDAGGDSD